MRIIIDFERSFYQQSFEKEVSPKDTIEDIEILISLTVPGFNTYDLHYKNRKLTNKKAQLKDVIDGSDSDIHLTVAKRGASTILIQKMKSLKDSVANQTINKIESRIDGKKVFTAIVLIIAILLLTGFLTMDSKQLKAYTKQRVKK